MLDGFSIFRSLSKEHIEQIEKIVLKINLKKGAVLFRPGDMSQGFFLVNHGALRVYRVSPKGKEITLEIIGPKNALAEGSLFSDIYHCFAEALKDSTIYQIEKKGFLKMLEEDNYFALEWIRLLSQGFIRLHQRIEELFLKSPGAKIASYINSLSEIQNSSIITLPTHQLSIATFLGMTHETFYRTTRRLKDEGIIRFSGQQIEIIKSSLLKEIIE